MIRIVLMLLMILVSTGCESGAPPAQAPHTADAGASTPPQAAAPASAEGRAQSDPSASAKGDAPAADKAPPGPKTLSEGPLWTPESFAVQWSRIYVLPDELPQKEQMAEQLQKHWLGRKVRWTGAALAGLCLFEKRRCSVNPFERTRTTQLEPLGGFHPLVDMTEAGWEAMRLGCAGQPQCVITFTGELAEVIAEPGRPLGMTFSGVEIEQARQPLPEERWFGRDRPKPATGKGGGKLRTGDPVPPKVALKPRVF